MYLNINLGLLVILSELLLIQAFDIDSYISKNMPEDGQLNFTELSAKYNHKCEEYDITTEDGYVLKLFRLRGDVGKPVFLMHGLLDTADTFLLRGESSLGITLADEGHDVWIGNCRGNKYARKHTTLNPDKDKRAFWDFSFHEFGVYDVPAMLDFIINETGQPKIPVIGHSQGNLIFYILGAEKPEYNDKIKLLIALNPIWHLNHVKELSAVLVKVWPLFSPILKALGVEEIFNPNSIFHKLTKLICTQNFGYDLCGKGIVFSVAGKDYEEIEKDFFPVVIGHYLAGTSRKDADHQLQLALKRNVSQFDYGLLGNLKKYGSVKAPLYHLSKVKMPIAILTAKNDNIATLEDVEKLKRELPNVVHYQVMEREQMNHVDLVWGKNMREYLFPVVFYLLQKYST